MRPLLALLLLCPMLAMGQTSKFNHFTTNVISTDLSSTLSTQRLLPSLSRYMAPGLLKLQGRYNEMTVRTNFGPLAGAASTNTTRLDLIAAITNCAERTVIFCSNGFYNIGTNFILMRPNTLLLGESFSNTIISFQTNTLGATIPRLEMHGGAAIGNFTMSAGRSNEVYTALIGSMDSNHGASTDNTNLLCVNINCIGDTDTWRWDATNDTQVDMYNCTGFGHWDSALFDPISSFNPVLTVNLYNCYFSGDDDTLVSGFTGASTGMRMSGNNTKIRAWFCTFSATNSTGLANDTWGVMSTGRNPTFEAFECSFYHGTATDTTGGSADNHDIGRLSTGTPVVTLTGGDYDTNYFKLPSAVTQIGSSFGNLRLPNFATRVVQTNFILNTVYRNTSGNVQLLRGSASLVTPTVAATGRAALDVMVDQAGGTTFVRIGGADESAAATVTIAGSFTNDFSAVLATNATYYLTNASAGTGNAATLLAGSGQLCTLGYGGGQQASSTKVYRALLTQSGTAAPVATVLENSLGGTVVWTRDSAGIYLGTLSGAFNSAKTFLSSPSLPNYASDYGISYIIVGDINTIQLKTQDTAAFTDDLLSASPVQILVFP